MVYKKALPGEYKLSIIKNRLCMNAVARSRIGGKKIPFFIQDTCLYDFRRYTMQLCQYLPCSISILKLEGRNIVGTYYLCQADHAIYLPLFIAINISNHKNSKDNTQHQHAGKYLHQYQFIPDGHVI